MTFHWRGSHSIFSVDHKKGSVLGGFCALGSRGGGHTVGARVLGAGPTVPTWMLPSTQTGRDLSAASNSHLPGQMQLVLLEGGQGEGW